MRKFFTNFLLIKTYLLLLLLLECTAVTYSQNIRLKIERLGLKIFAPTNNNDIIGLPCCVSDDCTAFGPGVCSEPFPDPVVNAKLIINTIEYRIDFSGDDYVVAYINVAGYPDSLRLTGWTQAGWNKDELGTCDGAGNWDITYPLPTPTSLYALWYTNNNFNTSNDINMQFNAFEDDNAVCGGDDAGCFGWNDLSIISDIPNTINPCGEVFKESMTCTSDGSTRSWGIEYKVSWQWRTLNPDAIEVSKVVCYGDNSIRVNTTTLGTLIHTDYQWQISDDATNWIDIVGNLSSVDVDISSYPANSFVYVRKVKKGIVCSGFPTPADEYSNICIINIKPAPTTAPTATKVPNISGVCMATIEDPIDEYNGTVPLTWEYQTSYDGITWSATQNTIPTVTNSGTTNVTGRIRFRAVYGCGASPWRTYSWLLYPQVVAPTAIEVYPIDLPFVTNYTCTTDSMYVIFNPGYGGTVGAADEYEYTTDGGATWLPYTNGERIRTQYGATLSYGIRARRTSSAILGSSCNTTTPWVYYGYWTPYRAATSPTLVSKTPNTASICITSIANVSATILGGSFGIGGQATDLYQYSIDSGTTWASYTSGTNISTTGASGAIMVRVRRLDGSATNECSTNWNVLAKWLIIDPVADFTYTSTLCYNPNAPYIELNAVNPSPGTGVWSITQGSGTLGSTTALNTTITGISFSAPLTRVRWTVAEAGCTRQKTIIITPTTINNANLTNGGLCQTCPVRNGQTLRFYDNTGKLMAQILDNATPIAELNTTEVCVGIDASVQSVTTNLGTQQPYLQRHFSIDPVNNTNTAVTLYFTATEFTNLQTTCLATPYAFTNINELIVSKFPNGGNNTYTLPNTSGGEYIIPTSSGLDVNGYYYLTIPVSTFSTFYIHPFADVPTVLPIELVYFDAKCDNDKIKLEWQTASENNNHHFEIERSVNATDFETIEIIPTKNGNANYLQEYRTTDNAPFNADNYYRLKQVDNNGQFSYSKIATAKCNTTSPFIQLYPNPTADKLYVSIQNINTEKVFVKIYSIYAALMYAFQWENLSQNTVKEIDTDPLSNGIYFIQIYDAGKIVYEKKFVKN